MHHGQHTCAELGPHLIARGDVSGSLAQRAGACGCVSERYDFAYIRQAGKMAGTTVQKSYLIPSFCAVWFPHGNASQGNPRDVLFGGATVPAGCEEFLARQRLLDCTCRVDRSYHYFARRSTFVYVRHPFARAVSIYKYVLETWSNKQNTSQHDEHPPPAYVGVRGFLSVFRDLETLHKYNLPMTAVFGGHGASSFHWVQQTLHVLPFCFLMPNTSIIPVEPDALANLKPIVNAINSRRDRDDAPLPLRDPQAYRARNALEYTCPWQCYFEICGQPCIDRVYEWFDMDVALLAALHIYPAPRSVADLWRREYLGEEFGSWLDVTDKQAKCASVCG